MAEHAVTFDFHDTLVHCDQWFELEVRHLPSAFLGWQARRSGGWTDPSLGPALDAAYRKLRLAIIQHGHELSAERCLALVCEQAGLRVSADAIDEGVRELMQGALDDSRLVPGAAELVRTLSGRGLPLGIVSSAVYHPFLEWALERHGIRDAFSVVTTSASSGYYKSRPEIYWETLAALGAGPSGSVHVGDSIRFDVGGAQQAGMRAVWLNAKGAAPGSNQPDLTLSSLEGSASALLSLLRLP